MKHSLAAVLLVVACISGWNAQAQESTVIVAPIYAKDNPNSNNHYFVRLLELALEQTRASHGPYELVEPNSFLVDDRLKAALDRGLVDVAWFNTSPAAEKGLLAIEEPLLGEINEYRLLLIREGDQARFSEVRSLEDLRQLTGGIGAQWVDADVMTENELPFVSVPRYPSLFRMLAAGRFDYFSRGLYQVKKELSLYPELNLAIEETLMLHYPNRSYFFVAKNNPDLAERIRQGLEQAKRDGSYEDLSNQYSQFTWAREQLQRSSRRILLLDTPPGHAAPLSP